MKCSFSYEVILFDGNNYFSETGVSFTDSYSEAASILEGFYQEDLMFIKHLELFEETPVITLPRKIVKTWRSPTKVLSQFPVMLAAI